MKRYLGLIVAGFCFFSMASTASAIYVADYGFIRSWGDLFGFVRTVSYGMFACETMPVRHGQHDIFMPMSGNAYAVVGHCPY